MNTSTTQAAKFSPLGKGGFHFIATVLDVKIPLPVDITPTLRLDRATDTQLEVIHQFLEAAHEVGSRWSNRYYYESKWVKERPTDRHSKIVQQPKEKWRYYVINFLGTNIEVSRFFSIADLVFPYLTSYAGCLTSEEFGQGERRGRVNDPLGSQSFYSYHMLLDSSPRPLNRKCLRKLQELLRKYDKLDKDKHEGILRAVEYHTNIHRLSPLNNLHVLGLFMIIEMLLTHNPNDKEIGDSLSHQIRTKIALLSPRFTTPLDYSAFGKGCSPDKLWGSLYAYRSCIAHGNHIDFSKGTLKVLKDSKTADEFLIGATKTILVHALIEPDLINALKPI
jgi:hypothetical protein